jgi:two-component system response regulator DesR
VRILIADDDPHVRSAVRLALEHEPGMAVIRECVTADALVDGVARSRPDVALVDWALPGLAKASFLERMRASVPSCRVVVLSGRPEDRRDALNAGAVSFVCKGDAPETLLNLLRALGGTASAD